MRNEKHCRAFWLLSLFWILLSNQGFFALSFIEPPRTIFFVWEAFFHLVQTLSPSLWCPSLVFPLISSSSRLSISFPVFLRGHNPSLLPSFPRPLTPIDLKWPRHVSAAAVLSTSLSAHFNLWAHQGKNNNIPFQHFGDSSTWPQYLASSHMSQLFARLPDLRRTSRRHRDECGRCR